MRMQVGRPWLRGGLFVGGLYLAVWIVVLAFQIEPGYLYLFFWLPPPLSNIVRGIDHMSVHNPMPLVFVHMGLAIGMGFGVGAAGGWAVSRLRGSQ